MTDPSHSTNPTASANRTADGQLAMPREYILSQDFFDAETDKVFGDHWLYVCHESELDAVSACQRASVRGSQLILVRGEDKRVKAFHNFCRHRGSELVTKANCSSIGQRIQCPYHAWTYDRKGKLLSAPNMNDQAGFDRSEFGLMEVECGNWNGFLFVRFRANGLADEAKNLALDKFMEPLSSHARDWSFSELKVAETITYDVAANWKLIFQNYSECYHCPTVHPALNRLTPFQGASNDVCKGPILGGPMSLSQDSQTMSSDGKRVGSLLPKLNEDQKRTVAYYTVFPSFFLSAHPDYVLIHRIERLTCDSTQVVCQFLFHPDSSSQSSFNPKSAIEFWDLTNRQDWEVCELAQRGIKDVAYQPGPYSDLESVVAAFDRHYYEIMHPSQS